MKVHSFLTALTLSFFAVSGFAQAEKVNAHDCLSSLSKNFQSLAATEKDSQLYVGAWPAGGGLCQGLLIKGSTSVDGKVSITYAYGPEPQRIAGEVVVEASVNSGELTAVLPWGAKLKYLLSDGKAFYTNKTGTYVGYVVLR